MKSNNTDKASSLYAQETALTTKRRDLLWEIEEIEERVVDGAHGDVARIERLQAGVRNIESDIERIHEAQSADMEEGLASGRIRIERGTCQDDGTDIYSQHSEYDQARRNIDSAVRSGALPDHAADKAHGLLEQGQPMERQLSARWAAAAGDPSYRDAFAKLLADPARGHLLWSAREAAAYRTGAEVNAELQRAMSLTDANGGYMVPLTLDPAIMLTSAGSNNPLRQLARIVQTTTDTWEGVTSAGATSEWKTEAAEAADGSPTIGTVSIPMVLGDAFVPYSYEVGMDASNFLEELQTVLVDSADNLQATAYTTGTGSGQPQGIVTGLVGTGSEINAAAGEAATAADAYALQSALPARFSGNATWQSHIATINNFRQLETTNGAIMFPGLHELPPSLLGKLWYENSNMDGSINAAASANNYAMIYGDVRAGFVIADRIGSQLELIPNLVGSNGRPTGQRGALLYFRTGSKVVNIAALRLLDIPTTA